MPRDRTLAITAVVVVHALVALWVWRSASVRRPHAVDAATALQIVWLPPPTVERQSSPVPPRRVPPADRAATPASTQTPAVTSPAPAALQVVSVPAAVTLSSSPPDAAALQRQLQQAARAQASVGQAETDAFSTPPPRLPGQPDSGRYRLREPVTPKAVLEGVGKLFGGGPTDPCGDLRRRVAAQIAAGGDRAELQRALADQARFCR